jgi:hypothetical protein
MLPANSEAQLSTSEGSAAHWTLSIAT